MEETTNQPKSGKVRHVKTVGVVLFVLVFGFCLGLWLTSLGNVSVTVPGSVTRSAQSAIYIPSKLPGNYTIDEASFSVQEGQVVVFRATDNAGGSIAFTEQPRLTEFDFQNFYKEQLENAETLDKVPFPTVVGKTRNQQSIMISIVTPDTWVVANTNAPLTVDDMKLLAQHISKYDQ